MNKYKVETIKTKLLNTKFKIVSVMLTIFYLLINSGSNILLYAAPIVAEKFNKDGTVEMKEAFFHILQRQDVYNDVFRWLAWSIIKFLAMLTDGITNVISKIAGMDAFKSAGIDKLVAQWQPIVILLFTAAVIIFGINHMINPSKKISLRPLLMAGLVLYGSASLFSFMHNITSSSFTLLDSNSSTSWNIVTGGFVDVCQAVNDGRVEYNNNQPIKNTPKKLAGIDINASRTTTGDSGFQNDACKMKAWQRPDGEYEFSNDLSDGGFIGWGKEAIYYYQIDFIGSLVCLAVLFIALLISSIKVARIVLELGFKQGIMGFVAVTDLNDNPERTKMLIKDIVGSYLVILITAVLMKIFVMYTSSWINEQSLSFFPNDYGSQLVFKIIMYVAAAMMLIDGPDIITKLLGIDAGLKDVGRTALTTGLAGYGLAKGAGSAATKVAGDVVKTGGFTAGAIGGNISGRRDAKRSGYESGISESPGLGTGDGGLDNVGKNSFGSGSDDNGLDNAGTNSRVSNASDNLSSASNNASGSNSRRTQQDPIYGRKLSTSLPNAAKTVLANSSVGQSYQKGANKAYDMNVNRSYQKGLKKGVKEVEQEVEQANKRVEGFTFNNQPMDKFKHEDIVKVRESSKRKRG